MISPHKAYIHDGGGAGDIIRNHIQHCKGWGYVELFKNHFPDSEILAIITCCNNQGAEFIKYNPHIDKIKELPWADPNLPWEGLKKYIAGYEFISKALKELLPKAKSVIPPVYLSPEDKQITREIQKAGKYIFIHPFAGTKERIVYPIYEYADLIDMIIDTLGYNVVVTGGTHLRLANMGIGKQKQFCPDTVVKEEFSYERNGLFNLVNRSNIRVGSYLARNASFYIGTLSCYSSCRFMGKPAIMFLPAHHYLQTVVLNKNTQRIIRIPMNTKDVSEYKNVTINHIRNLS